MPFGQQLADIKPPTYLSPAQLTDMQGIAADMIYTLYADKNYAYGYTTAQDGGYNKGWADNSYTKNSFSSGQSLDTNYNFTNGNPGVMASETLSYACYLLVLAWHYENRRGDPNGRKTRIQQVLERFISNGFKYCTFSPTSTTAWLAATSGVAGARPWLQFNGTGYEFAATAIDTSADTITFTGAGTITVTAGSAIVTGSSSDFLNIRTGVVAGGYIKTAGGQLNRIVSVDTATQLTCANNFTAEAGVAYYLLPIMPGVPIRWGTNGAWPTINSTPSINGLSSYYLGFSGNGYKVYGSVSGALRGSGAVDFTNVGQGPHRIYACEATGTGAIRTNYRLLLSGADTYVNTALEPGYTPTQLWRGMFAPLKSSGGTQLFGVNQGAASYVSPVFYTVTSVTAATDYVRVADWPSKKVGDVHQVYWDGTTGTLPGGVTQRLYWSRVGAASGSSGTVTDQIDIKLYTSAANAIANTSAVDITDAGSGTLKITPMQAVGIYTTELDALAETNQQACSPVLTISSIDTGTGIITATLALGLTTGTTGCFEAYALNPLGTLPTGVSDATTKGATAYGVRPLGGATFALYNTLANAQSDTSRIVPSSSGTGTTYIIPSTTSWQSAYVFTPRIIQAWNTGTGSVTFSSPLTNLGPVGQTGPVKIWARGRGGGFVDANQGTLPTCSVQWPGTITVTNGSATVTGTNTFFTQMLRYGRTFTTAGGNTYTAADVASDTSLTLQSGGVATETGVTFSEAVNEVSEYWYRITGNNSLDVYASSAAATAQTSAQKLVPSVGVSGNVYCLFPGPLNLSNAPDGDTMFAAAIWMREGTKYSSTVGLGGNSTSWSGGNSPLLKAQRFVKFQLVATLRVSAAGEFFRLPSQAESAFNGLTLETTQQANIDLSYNQFHLYGVLKTLSAFTAPDHWTYTSKRTIVVNRLQHSGAQLPGTAGGGTVSVTSGSTTLTGSGSNFLTIFPADKSLPWIITLPSGRQYRIATVTNDTAAVMSDNAEQSESAVTWRRPAVTIGGAYFTQRLSTPSDFSFNGDQELRLWLTPEAAMVGGGGLGGCVTIPSGSTPANAVLSLAQDEGQTAFVKYDNSGQRWGITQTVGVPNQATAQGAARRIPDIWSQLTNSEMALIVRASRVFTSCPFPLDFNSLDLASNVMTSGVQARAGYDAVRVPIEMMRNWVLNPYSAFGLTIQALAVWMLTAADMDAKFASGTYTALGRNTMQGGWNTTGSEYSSAVDSRILWTMAYCALLTIRDGRQAGYTFYRANIHPWVDSNNIIGNDQTNDYLRAIHLFFLTGFTIDQYADLFPPVN